MFGKVSFCLSYILLYYFLLAIILFGADSSSAKTKQTLPISDIKNMQPLSSPPNQPLFTNAILQLEAHLTSGSSAIKSGLAWRVFSLKVDKNDKLPLSAYSKGGSVEFRLAAGDYLIHVAFGKASATQRITLEANKRFLKHIVLNAGGIKLDAILPNGKINKSQLQFSIYTNSNQSKEQILIISNIKPNTIVRLNADTYYVVSNYGTANAIIGSDIKVEAGKLTEAVMQHRAAQITLKLVRQKGGEALADTSWGIINNSGDIVREIANAYAYIILAEGDYIAIAKNKKLIYQKEFSVSSGQDQEIEIPAILQNITDSKAVD
ncbi:MAG: hypothetical protein JSC188_000493 [Candidatus Tokpelaia sp. JSC188]|nr:MAG: hypothetical protein JSC188_000493 [Candidatus Tokpelaia sp. JSC188]